MVIIDGLVVEKGERWLLVRVGKEVEWKVYGDLKCGVGSYVRLRCEVKSYKNKVLLFCVDGGGDDA